MTDYFIFTNGNEKPTWVDGTKQTPHDYKRGDLLYAIEPKAWLRHNGHLWGSVYEHENPPTKEQMTWVLLLT